MNDMVSMRKTAPCVEFARAGLGAVDSVDGCGAGLGFEDDFFGGNVGSLAGQWLVASVLASCPSGGLIFGWTEFRPGRVHQKLKASFR
jgi:hypothetical protein